MDIGLWICYDMGMTDIQALRPAHFVGDTVFHVTDDQAPGKVLRVIPIISYQYEVEWEDDDPTDVYNEAHLKA